MTMMLMTALALTREIERGTMENLLAMPVRPVEIMVGKILPYIVVGFVQVAVILAAAFLLFARADGGLAARCCSSAVLLFIAANVTLGYTFSTLARTQMQAMQMTFFFFLPSILLSGFMFPFRGMPGWAQVLGEVAAADAFPAHRARHHAEGQRPLAESLPHLWPVAAFLLVIGDAGAAALPPHAGLRRLFRCSRETATAPLSNRIRSSGRCAFFSPSR